MFYFLTNVKSCQIIQKSFEIVEDLDSVMDCLFVISLEEGLVEMLWKEWIYKITFFLLLAENHFYRNKKERLTK